MRIGREKEEKKRWKDLGVGVETRFPRNKTGQCSTQGTVALPARKRRGGGASTWPVDSPHEERRRLGG